MMGAIWTKAFCYPVVVQSVEVDISGSIFGAELFEGIGIALRWFDPQMSNSILYQFI